MAAGRLNSTQHIDRSSSKNIYCERMKVCQKAGCICRSRHKLGARSGLNQKCKRSCVCVCLTRGAKLEALCLAPRQEALSFTCQSLAFRLRANTLATQRRESIHIYRQAGSCRRAPRRRAAYIRIPAPHIQACSHPGVLTSRRAHIGVLTYKRAPHTQACT